MKNRNINIKGYSEAKSQDLNPENLWSSGFQELVDGNVLIMQHCSLTLRCQGSLQCCLVLADEQAFPGHQRSHSQAFHWTSLVAQTATCPGRNLVHA